MCQLAPVGEWVSRELRGVLPMVQPLWQGSNSPGSLARCAVPASALALEPGHTAEKGLEMGSSL